MNRIFQLNIKLIDIEPEIWRRAVVPDSLTLRELHAAIQGAMGWQDYHLHMFEIGDRRFEIPENDIMGPEERYEDERKHKLRALISAGAQFLYVYDFGDDWNHSVTVEDVITPDSEQDRPAGRYRPLCIGGARACPPEDCGGPYNYPEFLHALADPKHPEHKETLDWADGFQSELFDIDRTNASIMAICDLYRERGWGFGER